MLPAAASAIDVKVNGQFWGYYSYASNPGLVDNNETGYHGDRTRARQRMRVQIQFIADENLSALLNFENNIEYGDSTNGYGAKSTYGALNADANTFGIKRAHLDWTVPGTQLKTRWGVQGIAMPGVAYQNPVFTADVAGISVSNQFTPNIGLTAFWVRPFSGAADQDDFNTSYDDMDVFGVSLPIKTDIINVNPWGMFAFIGKDSEYYTNATNYNGSSLGGKAPSLGIVGGAPGIIAGTPSQLGEFDGTTYGWWLGTTIELPVLDPFFVKLDAIVGGLETGDSDYDATGWYVSGDIGYKFSFASLSVTGFYSSGNDGEDDYGQLPIIGNDGAFNMKGDYAYGLGASNDWRRYDGYLTGSGQGMWGLGLKLTDLSFVNNLTHAFVAMYYGGTNSGDSVDNTRSVADLSGSAYTKRGQYQLTTSDHAWELTLVNKYQVNQNLAFRFDVGYIQLELGDSWADKEDTKGNFVTGVGVQYMF